MRRVCGAVALVLALAVSVHRGDALASTAAATVEVTPSRGHAGSTAQVTGSNFASGPAEVRWQSASGALLATARGPQFAVSVTIPQVDRGFYNVVVTGRNSDGSVADSATAAFEVTLEPAKPKEEASSPPPPMPSPSTDAPSSSGSGSEPTQAPRPADPSGPAPAPSSGPPLASSGSVALSPPPPAPPEGPPGWDRQPRATEGVVEPSGGGAPPAPPGEPLPPSAAPTANEPSDPGASATDESTETIASSRAAENDGTRWEFVLLPLTLVALMFLDRRRHLYRRSGNSDSD